MEKWIILWIRDDGSDEAFGPFKSSDEACSWIDRVSSRPKPILNGGRYRIFNLTPPADIINSSSEQE